MENVVHGEIEAQALINNQRDIDEYPLYDHEKQSLISACAFYFDANDPRRLDSTDNQCVVCYGDFAQGERLVDYPVCGHRYHLDCLLAWLATRTTCPVCRKGIRSSLYLVLQGAQGRRGRL